MKKKFDSELGEVEIRPKRKLGFCPLCGESMILPKKIKIIYVCKECVKSRLSDAVELDKEFRSMEHGEYLKSAL